MWRKRRLGYTCNVCAFFECIFTDTCNRIRNSYTVMLQKKFMYKSGAENKNKPYFYDLFMIIRYRLQSTFQSVFLYRPVCATMDTRDERY